MNWEALVPIAPVLLTMTVGGIIWGAQLRSSNAANSKAIDALTTRVDKADADLSAHKLHVAEAYVRKDDLEKMEARIGALFSSFGEAVGRRIEVVEHQLRNIDTRILSLLKITGRDHSE